MTPKLYCAPESGNCYKVRLLASLLDIKLEKVTLDFFAGAHKAPDFLAINPKGELPTLADGDKIFTDSSAILVYLAGSYPDRGGTGKVPSSYWSSDVAEQAQIVDWLAFTASWIHVGLCKARALVSFKWPPNASEETIAEAKSTGTKSLDILEARLKKENWLALGRPTVADVSIYVYVVLAPMGGVSLEPYPAVRAWVARMQELPGYISTEGLDKPLSP